MAASCGRLSGSLVRRAAFVLAALCLAVLPGRVTRGQAPGETGDRIPAADEILRRAGWVRVCIKEGVRSVRATATTGLRVCQGQTAESDQRYGVIDAMCDGGNVILKGDGKPLGAFRMAVLEPQRPATGGFFELSSNRYRGRLVLDASGDGMNVINELQVDDYLKGVLPPEIGADSPPEALKAQAVAARSEAVAKLLSPPHKKQGYDFCTGVHCMVYKGMSAEKPSCNTACDATPGIVIVAGGKVVDAVYHNVCGGVTAGAEDVWDGGPSAGIVAVHDRPRGAPAQSLGNDSVVAALLQSDPSNIFCNPDNEGYPQYERKRFRWRKTLGAAELQKVGGVGRVQGISVVERRPSGRVRKLLVRGDRGQRVIEKELPIRNTFGLDSGFFVVEADSGPEGLRSVTFVGAGHGHGAGMCQMGARVMAAKGNTWDQILAHYYRGSNLMRIYRP